MTKVIGFILMMIAPSLFFASDVYREGWEFAITKLLVLLFLAFTFIYGIKLFTKGD